MIGMPPSFLLSHHHLQWIPGGLYPQSMKTISVAAAIIIKDGLILATERGYGDYKDQWEFPGGKLEAGETGEDAIVREIREELDAEIKVERHLCTVEYDYPTFHLSMQCFICSLVDDRIVLLEHEDMKWLEKEKLDSLGWLPADLLVVEKLKEYLISLDRR